MNSNFLINVVKMEKPLEFINTIEILTKTKLDWDLLSSNQNIDSKVMEIFKDKLNMCKISTNSNISYDVLLKYIELLDYNTIVDNSKIIEILDNIEHSKLPSNFGEYMSKSKYLTLDIYKKYCNNIYWKWEIPYILSNHNISMDLLEYILPYTLDNIMYWKLLSNNPVITKEFLISNKEQPIDFRELSSNKSLTFDIILEFPNKDWSLTNISTNESIDYRIIYYFHENENNVNMNFCCDGNNLRWYDISNNEGLQLYDIWKLKNFPLHWDSIRKKMNIDKILNNFETLQKSIINNKNDKPLEYIKHNRYISNVEYNKMSFKF